MGLSLPIESTLGREPTAEDIFKDIDIGRVGRREPGPTHVGGIV